MFIPSIMSQANEEQQAYWLPLCYSLRIIGTYAQTELGHGTFVRGLETTATYDPQTKVGVLRSGRQEAMGRRRGPQKGSHLRTAWLQCL